MAGYLIKVLGIYIAVFFMVNFGWIISSFYLMSNSQEQIRFFSMQGFLIWLGCFLAGFVAVFVYAKPVSDGFDMLARESLQDKDLETMRTRNSRLPLFACLILIVMLTLFDIIAYASYMQNGIGPIASNGIWLTNIAANCALPICLYGMLCIVTYPAFNVIHDQFSLRGIPFRSKGMRLSTKMLTMFVLAFVSMITWLTMIGFYEGMSRIREEARSKMLSYQHFVTEEIRSSGSVTAAADELKKIVDRMNASRVGASFLADNKGNILYNPAGAVVFNDIWDDINADIRDRFAGGNPGSLYENIHEQVLCYAPVPGGFVIGSVSSMSDHMENFTQFFVISVMLVLIALGIVAVAAISLFYIVVRPARKTVEKLADLSTGEGDLTARLGVYSDDEMGELAVEFNSFISKLEDIMSEVRRTSLTLDVTAQEVAAGSQGLSQVTQEQASSIEQVAATTEQMTATIKHNAESASTGKEKAGEMVRLADHSSGIATDLVNGMTEISAASKKIGDIITTVNEVAFQTNLLALNAAVEAARAGEHGKGFAVVAEEVRALAQRSAEASREIKNLIEDTVNKIKLGDTMVKKTGESLIEINKRIQELSQTMDEIAASSNEQARGIDELNRAITQIDTSTQQNASMIEELASTSDNLKHEAGELAGSVGRFKVSDE